MAQAKFIPLLTTATGLNNTLDPVRIAYDLKTGESELSQAVNVDIDNSGRINRRRGRTLRVATAGRDAFVSGETCLFVSGTMLYRLTPGYTTEVVRPGLTLGARMRYTPIADRIYYTNGYETGYVRQGLDYAWRKGDYTPPEGDRRTLSEPPVGHLIGWFAGRALVAKGSAVFASEPSFYGVFDLHGGVRLFPEQITMLRGTKEGLWVGTSGRVEFYRGTKWEELRREHKAGYGVLEGSDALCPGEKLKAPGQQVLFTTPKGICAGSEDGTFVNLTESKLTFPSGRFASAAVAGDRYLLLINP
jgi:hypothetical protein